MIITTTSIRRSNNVVLMLIYVKPALNERLPSKHEALPNAKLMLGQRRRQWGNISPTLGQRFVFAGLSLMG